MTPVFLNPSSSSCSFSRDIVVEQNDQGQFLKLLVSPYSEEGSSSLSPSPTSFDSNIAYEDQDQTTDVIQSCEDQDHQKDMIDFIESSSNNNMNGGGSVKYWMSSKMRVIQKMSNQADQSVTPATTMVSTCTTTTITASDSDHQRRAQKSAQEKVVRHSSSSVDHDKTRFTFNVSGGVRVCSDCNTTSTPLWRSGPRGPKSLCNACGIRQRKARRAMAEAAAANTTTAGAGAAVAATKLPLKTGYNCKTHNNYHVIKEKKSRGNLNIGHYKGKFKLKLVNTANTTTTTSTCTGTKRERINDDKKLYFGGFAGFGLNDNNRSAFSGVFPKDVAEAAILLMELSCHGFVHS